MYEADKFVFLDDAQYSNGYVFNWNTIKVSNGTCRLRIPIKYEFGDAINQVKMRNELKWCDKHLKTVYMNYHKSKYFNDFFFEYRDLLLEPYDNLSQLNTALFITNIPKIRHIKTVCIKLRNGFDIKERTACN